MIRIELVNRRLPQLVLRGGIMIVGGAAVFGIVFAVNRLLAPGAGETADSPRQPVPGVATNSAGQPPDMGRSEPRVKQAEPVTRSDLAAGGSARQSDRRTLSRGEKPKRRRLAVSRGRRESGSRRRSRATNSTMPASGSTDPVWSLACRQTLMLYERLPQAIRFESLTSNAIGEYAIEGVSSSSTTLLSQVQDTLRAYSHPDSVPRVWTNRVGEGVRFSISGRLGELQYYQLSPLRPAQADELFSQVPAWARRSGLLEVKIKDPIAKPVSEMLTRRRQKIWGRGSQTQISSFVEQFEQIGQQAVVGEIVLIPVYSGDSWSNALMYAAVDILVEE